jgi:hypothetical protein
MKIMKETDLKSYLKELERKNADELNIILEIDTAYLSLEYLRELRSKWELQGEFIDKTFHHLLVIGLTSPVWLILGLTTRYLFDDFWMDKIIYLSPFALCVFIIGMLYLSVRFGTKNHQKEIGYTIYKELERRRVDKHRIWIS